MVMVIAHRGASASRPENTLEAFIHAVELGADAVELDVRRAADGHLVVCHDVHYPDGRLVSDLVFADRPAGVCDLADAIEACGELVVNVEIKNGPHEPGFVDHVTIADDVVALLEQLGEPDRFLVSSFDALTLDRVRVRSGDLATAQLTVPSSWSVAEVLAHCVERGHSAVHPHVSQVDDDYVRAAHEAGLEVNVWTVDDPETIGELAELGVDGIVTNVVDVARRVVDAR